MTEPKDQAPKPHGKIVIAGGTGFLGLNLARELNEHGCEVVLVSRHGPIERGPWQHYTWDGRSVGPWARQVDGAAAVVNLAGRSVDCRKTPDRYDEILRSRVDATLALGAALREADNPPPVWVQMSTAHRYGDPPEVVCDEDSSFGYGMAPIVGEAWERAFEQSVLPETRAVTLRTSFVLGKDGGALPRLAQLARLGLGGKSGHGRQGISWIHERDMSRLFIRGIASSEMSGAYIATAPNPVSNAEFMRELRRVLRVPIGLPAFEWMVRVGAPLLFRTDPELALYGRYCVSRRLADEGYEFEYPYLAAALQSLYRNR